MTTLPRLQFNVSHVRGTRRPELCLPVLALALAACTPLRLAPADTVLRRHAVFVGSQGNAKHALTETEATTRDVSTDEPMSNAEYRAYVDSIIATIRADTSDTVLIYIHGGRVGLKDGAEQSAALRPAIRASNYYPLFIVWDASQWTSLGWHLGRYHRGLDYRGVGRFVMPPFTLTSDLVMAVGRSPFTLGHQLADICRGAMRIGRHGGRPSDASCPLVGPDREERKRLQPIETVTRAGAVAARGQARGQMVQAPQPGGATIDSMVVSWGEYHLPWYDATYRGLTSVLYLPIKFPLGVVVDGLGSGAWDDMVRRTTAMFRPGEELRGSDPSGLPPARRPSGAVGVLMEALQKMAADDAAAPRPREWRFILAGHSMGAIVANRILREYPNLPVIRIQYLAPASSISDIETSVIPYLRRRTDATFLLGTLQPFAEAGELQSPKPIGLLADVFVPRGSLLEWIDDYFENSRSPFDRRAGKWRNIALGFHLFPDSVRARVTIKSFGVGDSLDAGTPFFRHPARHGEFNKPELRFWCRDFWNVTRQGNTRPATFSVLEAKRAIQPSQPGCTPPR